MFTFCPACGARRIAFDGRNRLACPDCGLVYYHNTACACAALIVSAGRLLVLSRAREPGRGLLDLPGGFVDPGEGALDALRRECREELGIDIGARETRFLGSWPNVYPYKGFTYNTCDMFFTVRAEGLRAGDVRLEEAEADAARFVAAADIADADVAFDSARRAIGAYRALYDHRH